MIDPETLAEWKARGDAALAHSNRKRLAELAHVEVIRNEPRDRPNVFRWTGINFDRNPCGLVIEYADGRDLTAAVMECYLGGYSPAQNTWPMWHLPDVEAKAGELWDKGLIAELQAIRDQTE